ncbi:MAG TPA: polysaccharide deacetylase family protein [Rhizomicrobium sp.]|nr:polysaccharide deacetylase family protein [Rhizomicrobium sp.]
MTIITLTFDNGPDPEVTPQVLDTLRRHEVKATFFVVGDKMRDRRGLAERAHAEGHWIGNHTFNHQVPLGLTAEAGVAVSEIERTQRLIGNLAHPRRFFRPFGGGGMLDRRLLNREAARYLCDNGFTCVLWNVIPQDWAHPNDWVDRALRLSAQQPHAVIVLHDLSTGAMRHLDRFIAAAKDRGARFEQAFPDSCVLIESGRIVRPLDAYVAEDADLAPAG